MLNKNLKVPIEKLYPVLIYNFVTGNLPSKSTYDERLLWQKVGYIAQQLGLSLNEYTFNWYKAGPYSPGYTSILYNFSNIFDEVSNYRLSDLALEKLEPMKVINNNVPTGMSTSKWFELVASILFLKKDTELDKKAVFVSLMRKKPFFNDENINDYAWNLLKKLDMI